MSSSLRPPRSASSSCELALERPIGDALLVLAQGGHLIDREKSTPSSSLHLRQCRFGLGEPEGHIHRLYISIAVDNGAGLLPLTSRRIQRPQAPEAVGLERAHAQLFGQDDGLMIVGAGLRALRGLALRWISPRSRRA